MYAILVAGAIGFVLFVDKDGGESEERKAAKQIGNGNASAHVDVNTKLIVNGSAKPKPGSFANGATITHVPSLTSTPNSRARDNPTIAALLALGSSILGALLLPNIVAIVLDKVLGKGMSWFSNEYSVILLFGPPALLGLFAFVRRVILRIIILSQGRCHRS